MKEKKKKKGTLGKNVARILGIPIGGLVGYWLAVLTLQIFKGISANLTPLSTNLVLLSCAILFAAIFCISAPAFAGWLVNIGFAIERTLNKYSAKDIAGGCIGLTLGLFFAFLISNLLEFIPLRPLSVTLIIIAYAVFGVIGMVAGTKKLAEIVVVKDKTARNDTALKVLDSSAIIDGRILDLAKTGFIEGTFIVPNFILDELRTICDSKDDVKRARGRRGLDIVAQMQASPAIRVIVSDDDIPTALDTDAKLLKLADKLHAKVITTDYNLNKVAGLLQITVLNINELVSAMKVRVLPGEVLQIEIVKAGKDASQGVGYLADGTMVVVENGGGAIGKKMTVTVTNCMQTAAGLMIFTRIPQKNV